jgi:hypothetical protein
MIELLWSELSGWNVNAMVDTLAFPEPFGSSVSTITSY